MINLQMRRKLVARAAAVSRNAYAPYSGFRVGAALLAAGGKTIVTGCNVENTSLGLTLCAERAALAAAVAAGFRRFNALAVVASGKGKIVPCGACLQALAEFCGPGFPILAAAGGRPDKIKIYRLRDLLPNIFRFKSISTQNGRIMPR